MKKIFLFLLFCLGITLSSAQDTHHSGTINDAQLKFLKENYNWNSEKILILNFLQPKYNCHYDAYEKLSAPSSWWLAFYKQIVLENCANRFVYSDADQVKRIIDGKIYFTDKNNFLLTHFFSKEPFCHGVLLVNQTGRYEQKSSEYSPEEITQYIKKLER